MMLLSGPPGPGNGQFHPPGVFSTDLELEFTLFFFRVNRLNLGAQVPELLRKILVSALDVVNVGNF